MNTKRIVSFLLTLALVLGLCPMTFAAETSEIYCVEATVNGVALGENSADITVELPDDTNYDVNIHSIIVTSNGSTQPFSGTFGIDSYAVILHFTPKSGFGFVDNFFDYLIHTSYATMEDFYCTYSDASLVEIIVTYSLFYDIDLVNLSVTGMEKGKSTTDVKVTVPAGAQYTVASFEVLDANVDAYIGTFDNGLYYNDIYLEAAEGCNFTYETDVVVTGLDPVSTEVTENGKTLWIRSQLDLRTLIDEVELTVTGMEKGKSTNDVKITLPAGAKYAVEGFEVLDANRDPITGTFDGGLYILDIYLKSAQGYYCHYYATEAIINGSDPDYFDIYNNGQTINLEYHLELRTPINEVNVTLTGIEEGKPASGVKVTLPAGVNYTLDELRIYDSNWDDFDGTFVKDRYVADIYLAAAEGYYFPEDAVITINGEIPHYLYNYSGNTLNLECRPDLRTPIDKVDITITGMEKGKPAAEISFTLPTGDKCQLVSFDLYDGQWEKFSGTFEKDLYTADIYLQAAEDYYFTEDLVATINGSAPAYFYVYSSGKNLNLEYELDLRTPISHVELPAWPTAPKAGSTVPDLPAFGTAGYYCTPFWTTMDGDLEPGDQFANNTVYYYVVTVLADYGFTYADDVTVTVGGEVYTGFTVDQGKWLFVYKTYPIGNAKLVDQINLSGAFPTAGKNPGEVTATGTGFTLEGVSWGVADNGDANNIDSPTKPFQAGEYVYLAMHIQPAEGYAFDLTGQIRFNGKVYSPIPQYSAINPDGTVTIAICLGQVRSGSSVIGDFTGDGMVTDADVIYLLWHTVFAEDYPIETNADFTGDGEVTDADVIYLLWHTVFPEDYPL